jgi:hypothetical protein
VDMDSSWQTLSPPLRFILEVSPSFTVTVLSEADLHSHLNVVLVLAHIEHRKYVDNGVYELFSTRVNCVLVLLGLGNLCVALLQATCRSSEF